MKTTKKLYGEVWVADGALLTAMMNGHVFKNPEKGFIDTMAPVVGKPQHWSVGVLDGNVGKLKALLGSSNVYGLHPWERNDSEKLAPGGDAELQRLFHWSGDDTVCVVDHKLLDEWSLEKVQGLSAFLSHKKDFFAVLQPNARIIDTTESRQFQRLDAEADVVAAYLGRRLEMDRINIYVGDIFAPQADAEELAALGVKLGTYEPESEMFSNCEVTDSVMAKLDEQWGRWVWALERPSVPRNEVAIRQEKNVLISAKEEDRLFLQSLGVRIESHLAGDYFQARIDNLAEKNLLAYQADFPFREVAPKVEGPDMTGWLNEFAGGIHQHCMAAAVRAELNGKSVYEEIYGLDIGAMAAERIRNMPSIPAQSAGVEPEIVKEMLLHSGKVDGMSAALLSYAQNGEHPSEEWLKVYREQRERLWQAEANVREALQPSSPSPSI